MEKKILDVCCGGKCFWFNKSHPNVIFNDVRKREKGFRTHRPNWECKPDTQHDFRDLPFDDNTFHMVVMDPPHLKAKGEKFDMVKAYGWLDKDTWQQDIKRGFDEAW